MRNNSALVLGFLVLFVLFLGSCSEDTTDVTADGKPAAPANLVGFIGEADAPDEVMILTWSPSSTGAIAGYNVYRTVGNGPLEKLNSALVTEAPFGPDVDSPRTLHFIDDDIVLDSPDSYAYRVSAVTTDGSESVGSNTVSCVPDDALPYSAIQNLYPSDQTDVERVPTFSWDAVTGAQYYLVVLQDEAQDVPGDILWLCQVPAATTSLTLGETVGVAYIDAAPDTLQEAETYYWGLFAIDDRNAAFAEGNAKFVVDSDVVRVLADQTFPAGLHCIMWDQKDAAGVQVADGDYLVKMTAEDHGLIVEDSAEFTISASLPLRPSVCGPPVGTPGTYFTYVGSREWVQADTVAVGLSVSSEANIRLSIWRDAP